MGKKGSWFSAVKKALTPEPKEKKEKKPQKPKRRWFGKQKNVDEEIIVAETAKSAVADSASSLPAPPPPLKVVRFTEPAEDEHTKLANTVVSATAMAAEAAVAAATEVFRFLHAARFPGKSTEEIAAIKIQAAVRGYLERRASRAWRGLVRLRLLIRGKSVQRQANTTLRCMQTLARVQYHIRARKIRLSVENQTLQRQLQQKREKDIEIQQKRDKDIEKLKVSMGDNWENSPKSKEKVEANLQYKQEAAMRRERALAYAYTQQQTWKNPSKNTNQSLMDPTTPNWGWSWLERWMAARPLETKTGTEKDASSDYSPSVMSTPSRAISVGELSRANSCHDLSLDIKASTSTTTTTTTSSPSTPSTSRSRGPTRQSFSFPRSKNVPVSPPVGPPPARPRCRRANSLGGEGDPRSPLSNKSKSYRQHSYAESLVSDDECPSSLSASPSQKANTRTTKSKSARMPSTLGSKNNSGNVAEKTSGFLKKRLSFSGSSSSRRRQSVSGSPKDIRVDA